MATYYLKNESGGDITIADLGLLIPDDQSITVDSAAINGYLRSSTLQTLLTGGDLVLSTTDVGDAGGDLSAADAIAALSITSRYDRDNPHSVSITQSIAADINTDITTAELERLTDGSDVSSVTELHQHDTRYYTETELGTSNPGTVTIHWDNITNAPPFGAPEWQAGTLCMLSGKGTAAQKTTYAATANEGDFWWDTDDDHIYKFVSSAWVDQGAPTEGLRVVFRDDPGIGDTSDDKIYEYGTSSWDSGTMPEDGWAVLVDDDGNGYAAQYIYDDDSGPPDWIKIADVDWGDHQQLSNRDATDAHPATSISYSNVTSGLDATTVQAAIDEIATEQGVEIDNLVIVAKNGNDSATGVTIGTWANPYATIQAAINSIPTAGGGAATATNRYAVFVMPGDYEENVTHSKSWVYLVGLSREGVKIKSTTGNTLTLSNTTEGATGLFNATVISESTNASDNALLVSGNKPIIDNVNVEATTARAVYVSGAYNQLLEHMDVDGILRIEAGVVSLYNSKVSTEGTIINGGTVRVHNTEWVVGASKTAITQNGGTVYMLSARLSSGAGGTDFNQTSGTVYWGWVEHDNTKVTFSGTKNLIFRSENNYYDNTTSGLAATQVQAAIDELAVEGNVELDNTIFVAKNGDDSAVGVTLGTIANPYETIQAALNAFNALTPVSSERRARILVMPGVYDEDLVWNIPTDAATHLSLEGNDFDSTTIKTFDINLSNNGSYNTRLATKNFEFTSEAGALKPTLRISEPTGGTVAPSSIEFNKVRAFSRTNPAVAEVTEITIPDDVAANMSGKYWLINDPDSEYYVWYNVTPEAEVTEVTCPADSAGDLGGTYWTLNDPSTSYYVWYDVPLTEKSTITCPADSNRSLSGKYWNLYSGGDGTQYYVWYFLAAEAEVTNVTIPADSSRSLSGKYWNLYSGGDVTQYYVWYYMPAKSEVTSLAFAASTVPGDYSGQYFSIYDGTTQYDVWFDTTGSESAPGGATSNPIKVDISSDTTNDQVAASVASALDGHVSGAWSCSDTTTPISVTHDNAGVTTDVVDTNAADVTGTVTTQGADASTDPAPGGTGIQVTIAEDDVANTVAGNTATAINGNADFSCPAPGAAIITVTTAATGDTTSATDGDAGVTPSVTNEGVDASTDPTPGGTGIQVNITKDDIANDVASATSTAINALGDFSASPSTNTVLIETAATGDTTNATDGDAGITPSITREGSDGSTDPAPGGTGIQVTINEDDIANAVASATATAINGVADFGCPAPGAAIITVTNANDGDVTDAADVDAGVSVNVTNQGIDASTDPAVGARTAIQIDYSADTSGSTIAGLTQSAIDALGDYSASVNTNVVTATNTTLGSAVDAADGDMPAGFSINVDTQGEDSQPILKVVTESATGAKSINFFDSILEANGNGTIAVDAETGDLYFHNSMLYSQNQLVAKLDNDASLEADLGHFEIKSGTGDLDVIKHLDSSTSSGSVKLNDVTLIGVSGSGKLVNHAGTTSGGSIQLTINDFKADAGTISVPNGIVAVGAQISHLDGTPISITSSSLLRYHHSINSHYDNSTSGLTATEVQSAIDEIDGSVDTNTTNIGNHVSDTGNPHTVTFTQAVAADSGTNITAAEAETLTDTSNADTLHTHDADNIGYDDTSTSLGASEVQTAIEKLDEKIEAFQIPKGTTFPTVPAPQDGDLFYRTDHNFTYQYDSSRSKWLSVTQMFLDWGAAVADGRYLRIHGAAATQTGYLMPRNGVIINVTARGASGNLTKGLQIRRNHDGATPLKSFSLSSGEYSSTTEDISFSAGDYIQAYARSIGTAVRDIVVMVTIVWTD